MQTKKYLSIKEASELCGRSYWMLRDAIIKGHLKAHQFGKGGHYYITPEALEAYFNNNEATLSAH